MPSRRAAGPAADAACAAMDDGPTRSYPAVDFVSFRSRSPGLAPTGVQRSSSLRGEGSRERREGGVTDATNGPGRRVVDRGDFSVDTTDGLPRSSSPDPAAGPSLPALERQEYVAAVQQICRDYAAIPPGSKVRL